MSWILSPPQQQANKLLQRCCVSGTSAPKTGYYDSISASRSGINNIEERFLINRELPSCSIKKRLSEVTLENRQGVTIPSGNIF